MHICKYAYIHTYIHKYTYTIMGLVGNNRPEMGMGPIAGMGPGGGADMLKMMGGSSAPPGNLFQQGHGNPKMGAFMGGHDVYI